MHKESATKTVTYLQSETVMQSVAMLTMDYRVMITEKMVRHQVDAQIYYPYRVGWSIEPSNIGQCTLPREFSACTSNIYEIYFAVTQETTGAEDRMCYT